MLAAVTPEVLATDLAERLVREGVPLRTAHAAVAALVGRAERAHKTLLELGPEDLAEPAAGVSVPVTWIAELGVARSVQNKQVFGGTAPERVGEALAEARQWLTSGRATPARPEAEPGRPEPS
jgi:argininosuccinate lyase